MDYFDVKITPQGLKEMVEWARANFSEELLDQFAEKLDKMIEFGGFVGRLIEVADAQVFKLVLKEGVGLLLGGEDK